MNQLPPTLWPDQARPGLAMCVGCVAALLTGVASAAPQLDPSDGRLDLATAAVSVAFDDLPSDALPVRFFGDAGQLADRAVSALARTQPEPLQGQGAFQIGAHVNAISFALHELEPQLGGQRVRISFWQRAQGAHLTGFVGWWTDPEAVAARFDPSSSHRLGLLRMLPSGRTTSDGWQEYTTGPIDFLMGGRIAPVLLVQTFADDLHGVSVPNESGAALLDAFSIEVLGPAQVPDTTCSLMTEVEACGEMGACLMGRCADHAMVHGPVFERLEDRRAYVERRIFEVQTFAGHQSVRSGLEDFEAALRALPEGPASQFWRGMQRAWLELGDGHGAPPTVTFIAAPQIGLCVTHGEADLVPGSPQTPLVFDRSRFHTEVQHIEVGDALVRIDGVPVAQWRQAARTWLGYNGDPDNAAYVESLQLARVMALAGARLEFERCPGPDACDSDSVHTEVLDLAEMMAPLWNGQLPAWRNSGVQCDGRFSRISNASSGLNGVFATSRRERDATILMINGVPGTFQNGWQDWHRLVQDALQDGPQSIILDQRIGNGGGFESLMHIVGFLDPDAHATGHFLMPWLFDLEGRTDVLQALQGCAEGFEGSSAFLWCGGARYETAQPMHPAPGASSGARLAVLNGRDVSGNDFLAYLLNRRVGATRIFGPGPTFGAFGMIMSLPEHGVGISGGSLQATDSAILWMAGDPLDQRLSGPGVQPHEVVLQKQSDAMMGVDTLMEVAHDWLQQ